MKNFGKHIEALARQAITSCGWPLHRVENVDLRAAFVDPVDNAKAASGAQIHVTWRPCAPRETSDGAPGLDHGPLACAIWCVDESGWKCILTPKVDSLWPASVKSKPQSKRSTRSSHG